MMFGELAVIKSNNRACLAISDYMLREGIINHSMHNMHSWNTIILPNHLDSLGMFMEEREIAL